MVKIAMDLVEIPGAEHAREEGSPVAEGSARPYATARSGSGSSCSRSTPTMPTREAVVAAEQSGVDVSSPGTTSSR